MCAWCACAKAHIISRLKKGERQIADQHEQVTILFSDIVSFTTLAQKLKTIEVRVVVFSLCVRWREWVSQRNAEPVHDFFSVFSVSSPSFLAGT